MTAISLKNISVELPIYNASSRSLKRVFLGVSTGGRISGNKANTKIVKALINVSFELRANDRLALIGHNGAGKTSLLRLIAGIYKPTCGNIKVIGKTTPMFSMGIGIDPEATGFENIIMRGLYLGLSKKQIEAEIDEIADFTELGDYLNMPVHTYSSGMSTRLALAVCTTVKPEILLLDEGLGVADQSFINKAQSRINEMIDGAKILVFASHNKQLIEQWCNKALWLEHGEIMGFGNFADVFDEYQASFK